ncbi:hypothetical protein PTKIN_Ptkin05aG0219000 [Pterospermum kingtungense]
MLSPNPNAEAMANNYDLLTQILARLPVKSLLRLKSVSKAWYFLISNPSFSRRVFPDKVSGPILRDNFAEHELIPLGDKSIAKATSLTCFDRLAILQSCHGLLLCIVTFQFPCSRPVYCIYNPTREEFFVLPPAAN